MTDDEIVAAVRERLREGQWLLAAPATPAELAEAERMLGFGLPPLLRRVYTEVANGGFEPFEDLDFIVENDREWRADDITPGLAPVDFGHRDVLRLRELDDLWAARLPEPGR